MFNMESRHLLNLSVQNALDCILENFNLKNFPGEVLMGAIIAMLPLYTISLGPLYHKILHLPLNTVCCTP